MLELEMPWVRSLKEKRSLVKPVTERLKTRFPLSVARLDGQDAHDWELIGAVAVGHDPVWLNGILEKALSFVESSELRVAWSQLDVEVWDREG